MALLLKKAYELYFHIFEELADPRTEHLPLMSSPFPTIILLVLYYKFIYDWGPKFMEKREPYDLKNILIVFNLSQVIANGYLVLVVGIPLYLKMNWVCQPIDWSRSPQGYYELHLTYVYYLLKVLDLLDTVFFVLKKNYRQVSFLHVYHHIGMTSMVWVAVKFIPGGQGAVIGLINCFVHTVMYGYYLLTAYDPVYKKSVLLKKNITQLQLIQFCIFIFIFGRLMFIDCSYPKIVSYFFVPQNFFMLVLFGDFYYKCYIKQKPVNVK
ncbi:unnamed protein product [Brassicogethes aeneus]|uniref:Elongation of very long chain fatty acids protein n=1 Tax=Brassicogethes aeneus TaxID=1431903 RepID=A0A9P0B418_BRAAE|nr:unnamed protein product [Brassicogethes aeneus]